MSQCYSRCGHDRIPPSAYCRECDRANRQRAAGRGVPPGSTHAQCGTCLRTFRNVEGFDAHRQGGACLDPTRLGYVEKDGVWATPEGHAERDRLRAEMAAVRSARTGRRSQSQSGGKP